MNNTLNLPPWWLAVSAAFFVVNLIFFVVMSFLVLRLAAMVKELQPKVVELTQKVEALVDRVEKVAAQVEDTTKNVNASLTTIGRRTTGILGAVETIGMAAASRIERLAPLVAAAVTGLRLAKAVGEFRSGKAASAPAKVDRADVTNAIVSVKTPQRPKGKKLFGIF